MGEDGEVEAGMGSDSELAELIVSFIDGGKGGALPAVAEAAAAGN